MCLPLESQLFFFAHQTRRDRVGRAEQFRLAAQRIANTTVDARGITQSRGWIVRPQGFAQQGGVGGRERGALDQSLHDSALRFEDRIDRRGSHPGLARDRLDRCGFNALAEKQTAGGVFDAPPGLAGLFIAVRGAIAALESFWHVRYI